VQGLEPAPATAADPIADLVRLHQAGVWRFLRSLGCQSAEADELAAEAFVVAHDKGLATRACAPGEAAAFLRRTARFLWLRRVRWWRRESARFADAAELLWARTCARDGGDAWLDALQSCLHSLDGRAGAAVRMFYGEDLSRAAVAARLGLRPNGVKTLLQRARVALRACIERRLS
jgi:RNA polymerase sigma-70 factor (ECF subfamily)